MVMGPTYWRNKGSEMKIFSIIPQPYHKISNSIQLDQLLNQEIYLIEPYDETRILLLQIKMGKDGVYTKLYDEKINELPKEQQLEESKPLQKDIFTLTNLMIQISCPESVFYYNKDKAIIEWLSNNNQFASFGMMDDVIGRLIKIPMVKKKIILTKEEKEKILNNEYGDVIVRPNIFKTTTIDNQKVVLRWRNNEE